MTNVQPTRRTLTKGIAWSAPVMAAAASARAIAGSCPPPGTVMVLFSNDGCSRGNVDLRFDVSNAWTSTVTVAATQVTFSDGSTGAVSMSPVAVAAGGSANGAGTVSPPAGTHVTQVAYILNGCTFGGAAGGCGA